MQRKLQIAGLLCLTSSVILFVISYRLMGQEIQEELERTAKLAQIPNSGIDKELVRILQKESTSFHDLQTFVTKGPATFTPASYRVNVLFRASVLMALISILIMLWLIIRGTRVKSEPA